MWIRLATMFAMAFSVALPDRAVGADKPAIEWLDFSPEVFARAKADKKFVILDMHARWCHWCHVMEETTYRDAAVIEAIRKNYLAVRADVDARPDLGRRYHLWGWPATVLFTPDGVEIVKLRGYRRPDALAKVLDAAVEDPDPIHDIEIFDETPATQISALPPEVRERLDAAYREIFDETHAGFGRSIKFLHANAVEYALSRALRGDRNADAMARRTLDAGLNLIDPVWGGIYQYSDRPDWKSPHYEKIMESQMNALRLYALGYARWRDARHLAAARAVARYLAERMRDPSGAFYATQDADVSQALPGKSFYSLDAAGRARLGVAPPIDKNLYARENGWAIQGLAALYEVTGDRADLELALGAARWVLDKRALPGGGFAHGERDAGGPFLGDTLAVGRAFLALYAATGERAWLAQARAAAGFIAANFVEAATGGFVEAKPDVRFSGDLAKPPKHLWENVWAVRFLNLLGHYTSDARYALLARQGLGYLASDAVAKSLPFLPDVLIAGVEVASAPLHITVVGSKRDRKAAALFGEGRRFAVPYKRLDWWDRAEGPLPNPDVEYPEDPAVAGYTCTAKICSPPNTDAAEFTESIRILAERG